MLQFRYKMTFLGLYMPDKCLYDRDRSVTLSNGICYARIFV